MLVRWSKYYEGERDTVDYVFCVTFEMMKMHKQDQVVWIEKD